MGNFKQDLYRYYGRKETFKERLLRSPEIKYIRRWRSAQNSKYMITRKFYKFLLRRLSQKTMIQIPPEVIAGDGFYIGHCGRIIIHPSVVMGTNINVATGVTIGRTPCGYMGGGTPKLGSYVWIGTNAVIVGNISIGNDVLIAPGAYINRDVPDHSIAIGNPAVLHHCDNATKDYINKTV